MPVVHTELQESIDRLVGNPTVASLYREWVDAGAGGRLPAFERFSPIRRPAIAGNLAVLIPEGDSFRYRSGGDRTTKAPGDDMTSRRPRAFPDAADSLSADKYRAALASRRPLYMVHEDGTDGATAAWERLILPLQDDRGTPVIVCYTAPLDRRAEIFDSLLAASMDGIAVLQPVYDAAGSITNFRYVIVNPRAGEILGCDAASLIGEMLTTRFPRAERRLAVYREVMESHEARQFEIDTLEDGHGNVYRLSAVRAGDALVVTMSDITALRLVMQRLEHQQTDLLYANETLERQASDLVVLVEGTDRARADALAAERFVTDLMEAVPIPLFHWNLDGSLSRSNRHYAAIYDETPESIVGKTPEDLLPPACARRVREENARLFDDPEGRQVYETDLRVDGRGIRHFVVHRALMRDHHDRPVGIAGAMLDVTDEYDLRKRFERLAATDPLTGLYNRRIFMERLEEEAARFRRYGRPTSTILLDIDHFKQVNDSFGHDFGDRVLIRLAQLLREGVREGVDLPARFGGEEFIVLLPDTTIDNAGRLAERLRRRFADVSFETGTLPRHFSASFGVASLAPGEDINRLLKRTDEALYRSKDAGRNRVTIDGGPTVRAEPAPIC